MNSRAKPICMEHGKRYQTVLAALDGQIVPFHHGKSQIVERAIGQHHRFRFSARAAAMHIANGQIGVAYVFSYGLVCHKFCVRKALFCAQTPAAYGGIQLVQRFAQRHVVGNGTAHQNLLKIRKRALVLDQCVVKQQSFGFCCLQICFQLAERS